MIKAVKCPELNISERGTSAPVLEVLLRFSDSDAGNPPTHILGCPKYNLNQKRGCGINQGACIYSEGWKELLKP